MRAFIPVILLLSVSAVACTTSWEPQYGPAPQVVAAHTGRTVRVLRKSGPTVTLENARVVADSIVGESGRPPQYTAIPVADVQVITVARADNSTAKTALVVAGATLVALAVVGVLWLNSIDDWFK
jgi:hypothetical protein